MVRFHRSLLRHAAYGGLPYSVRRRLHGATRPVTVNVIEKAGHYTGHAVLRQTEFGMKPLKVAGGAVRVKDEVRIEFDIQLAR